jgi:putative NADPH-quinone reductase
MRVLVIYCHPNETSFASELHQTYCRLCGAGATRSLTWIYMARVFDL